MEIQKNHIYSSKSYIITCLSIYVFTERSAIWDKLPEYIFETFEIARVKPGQFQNFQKPWGWFIPKIARTEHVITG